MNTELSMKQYYNEIAAEEYEPISNEEIRELIRIAQSGYNSERKEWVTEEAIDAKNEVVKRNIRLVPYVVHKVLKDNRYLFMDCVNECHFSIVKCIIGYDLESRTNFATYAQVSISRHVWRFLRENSNVVTLPYGKVSERKKEEDDIYSKPGVLNRLFKKDFKPVNHVCSLDYNYDDGTKIRTSPLKEISVKDDVPSKIFDEEIRGLVIESFSCLTDKERTIIKKRYLSDKKMTLRNIATDIGMSGERVRQIEQNALFKMKKFLLVEKGEQR